jgi:hypothetical protein
LEHPFDFELHSSVWYNRAAGPAFIRLAVHHAVDFGGARQNPAALAMPLAPREQMARNREIGARALCITERPMKPPAPVTRTRMGITSSC